MRAEINTVIPSGDVSAEDIDKLHLTRAVFYEAMRLYPPAPQMVRDCVADANVAGIEVKKGMTITIPIYALHRNPDFWHQPNAFIPKRFLDPEVFTKQNRFRYLPFGGDARVCLGQAFVMTEVVTMLVQIVRTFTIKDATEGEIEFETGAALRAKGGIFLKFSPR